MRELKPFEQLPFEDLPLRPRVPHGWAGVKHETVTLRTDAFGEHQVHYVEAGEGEPLLLVHGLMWRAFSWRYVVEPLSKRYRVIIPDLVGAGLSDAPDVAYTPEAMAAWLAAFVDALDLRGCRCVGNSLGGYLCMQAALSDPSLFRCLVNLHSPGIPEPRLYALWFAIRIPGLRALFEAFVARDPMRWSHKNVHYYDESLKSVEEVRQVAEPLRTAAGRRAFSHYLADTVSPFAMRQFVRTLQQRRERNLGFPIPLQLVYASSDPMVPPHVGRALAELLPDAEVAWLDEASHFAHVDAVEPFLDAVAEFLS
ncbi:MAG: alpha/beta fold hydrolase [Proteobacteria bacterium]|nr:alpha/beta fold hydrolase [Pseudomonadota bacterium]